MSTPQMKHQTKKLALPPIIAIALTLLFSALFLIHPVYAATPGVVECPVNGAGSVQELRDAITALNQPGASEFITINVTGPTCVFTVMDSADKGTGADVGLPIITRNATIRAVGGQAVIERAENIKAFRF